MPRTNNIVHHEAQLREAINTEEVRAKRWDQSYGARLAGPDAYKVRHVWDPQSLSKEAKLFASRGRSEVRRRSSVVQHAHFARRRVHSPLTQHNSCAQRCKAAELTCCCSHCLHMPSPPRCCATF